MAAPIIEPGPEALVIDDGLAERDPALAQLAAAVFGHHLTPMTAKVTEEIGLS